MCPIQAEPVLKKSGITVAQGKEEIAQYITNVNESVGDGEQQEQEVIYTKCILYIAGLHTVGRMGGGEREVDSDSCVTSI